MIDPRILTEQPETVKAHLKRRHADEDVVASVDDIVTLGKERNLLLSEGDELRSQRNRLSKDIGQLMREGKKDQAESQKTEVAAGNARIKVIEQELETVEERRLALSMQLPNLLHEEVPEGRVEADNPVVRTWGEPRTFDFEPQAHVEVGARADIVDLERSAKMSGARFAVLKGGAAQMERALINFFVDLHTRDHGYTEVMVPYIVQKHAPEGTGQLPKFGEGMFKLAEPLNGSEAYLIPTAEVPVTNLHRDEIIPEASLPIRYVCFTPCFRSEAGAAGRDVRGLIRLHQFHKVELVWFTTPERAEDDHQTLVRHAETCLELLGLPYQTVLHCGGETSFSAHRCYDLEVWLPSQNGYREISSCSHFTDFQARRMAIRYRPNPVNGKKSKARLLHTINGSGLAVGRTLVAILENYQQADGSISIPEVLRPYMNNETTITPPMTE